MDQVSKISRISSAANYQKFKFDVENFRKKVINLKISSAMSQYLLNYKYEFIKSKKIGDNLVKITVDNSFELNNFILLLKIIMKKMKMKQVLRN